MRGGLYITVCTDPDCRWSNPTYEKKSLERMEQLHMEPPLEDHCVFKRLVLDDQGIPEVIS